jgi:hypothetical protein
MDGVPVIGLIKGLRWGDIVGFSEFDPLSVTLKVRNATIVKTVIGQVESYSMKAEEVKHA